MRANGVKNLICLGLLIFAEIASAGNISFPFDIPGRPARDLIYQGHVIDPDSAIDVRSKGVDLSTLDPHENDVWSSDPKSLTNENELGFPTGENPVLDYDSYFPAPPPPVAGNDERVGHILLFWSRLTHNGQPFRIAASLGIHGAIIRNALLRKMGYKLPSPKHYEKLTVRFKSKSEREEFMTYLARQVQGDQMRWVIDLPENNWQLTMQDVTLEQARIDVPTLHLGIIDSAYLEDRRAIRSLIVPFTWLDIHESVNMLTWEMGNIINEAPQIFHPYANQFAETTIEDARWAVRKIARLTREEIVEIIKLGKFPADVEALVIEKVIARRNHLLKMFRVPGQDYKYNPMITIGNVVDGKLKEGSYPGHAERFIWRDPESPLTPEEVGRFGIMMGFSSGIAQAVAELNKHLEILGVEELQKKRIQGLQKNFIDAFKKNPFKPYNQPVSTWGGFVANGGVEASRNLVTGTYYGTDQSTLNRMPLQLVDQVGVRLNAGYIRGIDGVHPNIFPMLSAGGGIQRSYVHVRPVGSVKAAMKQEWGDIYVPEFMNSLANVIKIDETITSQDINRVVTEEEIKSKNDQVNTALKEFLDKFGIGEVFTISDVLTAEVAASVRIPLTSLLPVSLADYDPAININGGVGGLILRRTTITRTDDGVHVYIQRLKNVNQKAGIDFRLWIKFAEMNVTAKQGYIDTKAYLLDGDLFDPEGKPNKDVDQKTINAFAAGMRQVLKYNSIERLEKDFSPYVLRHELDAVTKTLKVLLFQRTDISENHLLRAFPPKPKENEPQYDPKDFERKLFSTRNTQYKGRRFLPTISEVLGKLVERDLSVYDNPGPNPAFSFFGKAQMSELRTDGEITGGTLQNPVSTTTHSWQGWFMNREELLSIIDSLNEQITVVNAGIPAIRKDQFLTTEHIQFYDIRTTLLIYEKAMKHLVSVLVESAQKPPVVLPDPKRVRAFSDNFTSTDPQVVDAMADLMGRQEYADYCAFMNKEHLNKVNSVFIDAYHYGYKHKCISNWMSQILTLRREYPTDPQKQIKWVNELMTLIQENVDLGNFLKWLDKKNFFFQVKISGFRKNDERGDKDYVSDIVGNFNGDAGLGVFKDFIQKYKILSNEVEAKYFVEGN